MKILGSQFNRQGFIYELVARDGDIAVYSQRSKSIGTKDLGKVVGYEVFKVQSHDGLFIHGVWIEPSEYIPSNAEWGQKGWSFFDEKKAMEKFQKLIKAR